MEGMSYTEIGRSLVPWNLMKTGNNSSDQEGGRISCDVWGLVAYCFEDSVKELYNLLYDQGGAFEIVGKIVIRVYPDCVGMFQCPMTCHQRHFSW